MSDLHDLSNPTEEAPEEIVKKENQLKEVKRNQSKEDLLKLWIAFKQKYLKKLFLALGIAVTVCIALIWGLDKLLSKSPAEEIQVGHTEEPTVTTEDTVKFVRFDGHQYYFYVPESYSFLNRTRNDDLNEIVFSNENGDKTFLLQEFEASNDNEETLDSIYSYIATTVPPDQNTEIKIGENTFKKRIYTSCAPGGEPNEGCDMAKDTYYSIPVNGIVIIAQDLTSGKNNVLETSILNTFTKNVIDTRNLSEDYVYGKVPNVKNKLQAIYAFGPPLDNRSPKVTWQTASDFKFELGFGPDKSLITAKGFYGENFIVDMQDGITNEIAKKSLEKVMGYSAIQNQILTTNPDADIFMDDHIPNDEYWEVTISQPEDEGTTLLAEYRINKNTYIIEEVSDTN